MRLRSKNGVPWRQTGLLLKKRSPVARCRPAREQPGPPTDAFSGLPNGQTIYTIRVVDSTHDRSLENAYDLHLPLSTVPAGCVPAVHRRLALPSAAGHRLTPRGIVIVLRTRPLSGAGSAIKALKARVKVTLIAWACTTPSEISRHITSERR